MSTNAPGRAIAVRVYYEDTDAGGVVYYANYLRFFERARTELLRACGIGQAGLLAEARIGFVVRKLEVDYHASARLDDELIVTAEVEKLGGASVAFVQHARRSEQLLAAARVRVACFDFARGTVAPIPPTIALALSSFAAAPQSCQQ